MQSSPRKSVKSFQQVSTPTGFGPDSAAVRPLLRVVHWVVGLLLGFAIVSPIGYHIQAIFRNNLSLKWNPWFGVNPKDKSRYALGKESLPVAYFFFFVVLPVVVAAILFSISKAQYRGEVFHALHIKPKIFGRKVSIGEILFVTVALVGNVLVYYHAYTFQMTLGKAQLAVVSIALAFSGLYNLVFLALPASRHCFWMEWLNLPWARGVKYHRWFGIATIFCFTVHFLIFLVHFAKIDALHEELLPCFDCDIATIGKDAWINVYGEISLLCMLIMGATSIPYVRRHYYATFKATHFLFIPAAAFAVMHYEQIIVWIFLSMVIYIVNRMYSSSTVAAPVALETAEALPGHVTQLTFKCSTTYLPGDVVYVQVPAISKTQWHPFSVASTPLHTPGLLTVYIKGLGHWTNQLHDYVKQCKREQVEPVVYLDAGYTPPSPMSPSYKSVVFVGGGIGVTPLMGQIMHLLHARPQQDVHLIWHVKTVEMVTQFQKWLKELEDVAERNNARLQVHIHVTQQDISEISIEHDEPIHKFALQAPTATPRPYAHLSTTRKLVGLLLAFFVSGIALYFTRYRQPLIQVNARYWPWQRLLEFVVVAIGSCVAYAVGAFGRTVTPPVTELTHKPTHAELSREQFLAHFDVKFERANWAEVFQSLKNEHAGSPARSVGIYVSGPKALAVAIESFALDDALFDMHQEEFEM